jgi:hypothetical protein
MITPGEGSPPVDPPKENDDDGHERPFFDPKKVSPEAVAGIHLDHAQIRPLMDNIRYSAPYRAANIFRYAIERFKEATSSSEDYFPSTEAAASLYFPEAEFIRDESRSNASLKSALEVYINGIKPIIKFTPIAISERIARLEAFELPPKQALLMMQLWVADASNIEMPTILEMAREAAVATPPSPPKRAGYRY